MRYVRLKKGDTLMVEGIPLDIPEKCTIGVPKGCKVFREERVTWIVRSPTEVDIFAQTADNL